MKGRKKPSRMPVWAIVTLVVIGIIIISKNSRKVPSVSQPPVSKPSVSKPSVSVKKAAPVKVQPKSAPEAPKKPMVLDNNTLLAQAAAAGNTESIKQLLEKGANINARDGALLTPLHKAAKGNHLEAVKLLIKEGADVKKADKDTSLLVAAAGSNKAVFKYLIKQGAEVNAPGMNGTKPLNAVLSQEDADVYTKAKALVKKGAEVTSEDRALAEKTQNKKLVKLLR